MKKFASMLVTCATFALTLTACGNGDPALGKEIQANTWSTAASGITTSSDAGFASGALTLDHIKGDVYMEAYANGQGTSQTFNLDKAVTGDIATWAGTLTQLEQQVYQAVTKYKFSYITDYTGGNAHYFFNEDNMTLSFTINDSFTASNESASITTSVDMCIQWNAVGLVTYVREKLSVSTQTSGTTVNLVTGVVGHFDYVVTEHDI